MYITLLPALFILMYTTGAILFIVFWLGGLSHPESSSKSLFLSYRRGWFSRQSLQINALAIIYIVPPFFIPILDLSGETNFLKIAAKASLASHAALLAYLVLTKLWRDNRVWTVYFSMYVAVLSVFVLLPDLADVRIYF